MANRTVQKIFRCTPREAEEISRMAKEADLSESDFIRKKVFRFSDETDQVLKNLEHYDLKIGNNINQIVRSCNSKKFITNQDIKDLTRLIENLVESRYEFIQQLKTKNEKEFLSVESEPGRQGEKFDFLSKSKKTIEADNSQTENNEIGGNKEYDDSS